MLRSAIGYVIQSGLVVGASNSGDKLVIVVHRANLSADHNRFVPVVAQVDIQTHKPSD